MRHHSLVSWLINAVLEGVGAGILSGLAILVLEPDLRGLITGQPEPALAFAILLTLCAQTGILVSIFISTAMDFEA